MGTFLTDLRIALRNLGRARGYTAAVVGSLALATALAASLSAIVSAYLVRELPYPEADRLYSVSYARPGTEAPSGLARLPWETMTDVVEHPISWDLDMFYLVGGDYPESAPGAWVTRGFMEGLGIRPALGRVFVEGEFDPGGAQVALISDALWRRRFGADSSVVGNRFEAYVSDRPDDPDLFTIVGVLPAGFWHLNPYTEILTPLRAPSHPYLVRLREGVTPVMGEQRLTNLVYGSAAPGAVELRPLQQQYTRTVRPILTAIGAAVALVLLIAGANVAFLAVIRGVRRQREMAVRRALGASRAQLARLLGAEGLLLVGAAALIGLSLAAVLLRLIAPAVETQLGRPVPGGVAAVTLDSTVALAIGLLLLLMLFALTLSPLAGVARTGRFEILRGGKSAGSRGQRLRSALIAVEVAGSLALVTGCGLMVRSVVGLLGVDLGIEPSRIITAGIGLRDRSYPDQAVRAEFYDRLTGALSAVPGVTAATLSFPSPLSEFNPQPVRLAASGPVAGQAEFRAIGGGYLSTVGLPVVRGRDFGPQDRGGAEPVALVSETAAQQLWPGQNPIGQPIWVVEGAMTQNDEPVGRTVIGVVRDAPQSPGDSILAEIYVPLNQAAGRFVSLVLRTDGTPRNWLAGLREVLRGLDPEIALGTVRPLPEVVAGQLARPRFLAGVFAGFGGFATLLALIGVYGVMAYSVKQREQEVAIRLALGADPAAIRRLFLWGGGALLLAGVALGFPAALGMGRLLRAQLYGISPLDPLAFLAAGAGLGLAGLAAAWPSMVGGGEPGHGKAAP